MIFQGCPDLLIPPGPSMDLPVQLQKVARILKHDELVDRYSVRMQQNHFYREKLYILCLRQITFPKTTPTLILCLLYDFWVTVKAAPHKFVIRTGQR